MGSSGVAGSTTYALQESANGGGWTTVQTINAGSWSTSGRRNGNYAYRVQGCNVSGCGPFSATGSIAVLLLPVVPGSISVPTSSSGIIPISWAAVGTATSYTLQQSVNGGGWSQIYAAGATSTSIQAATTGSYTFRVNACNASGCSGFTTSAAVAVTLAPAGAPAISVLASSATGSYSVGWSAVAGSTVYVLQESANGPGWATVQSTGASSWSTTGRGNGSYGYRVQGCNAGGCGPFSATGTITITVALLPAAPTGLEVVQYTVNAKREGYRAQWNGVAAATSYEARRTDTGATVYAGVATDFIVVEDWTPIDPDAVYDVQVRACNASGCSGWSP